MKVGIIGASGMAGSAIYKLASENKDLEVTGIVRDKEKAERVLGKDAHLLIGDVLTMDDSLLENFDVIVDAFGTLLNLVKDQKRVFVYSFAFEKRQIFDDFSRIRRLGTKLADFVFDLAVDIDITVPEIFFRKQIFDKIGLSDLSCAPNDQRLSVPIIFPICQFLQSVPFHKLPPWHSVYVLYHGFRRFSSAFKNYLHLFIVLYRYYLHFLRCLFAYYLHLLRIFQMYFQHCRLFCYRKFR